MKEGGIYTGLENTVQWGTSWKELTKYYSGQKWMENILGRLGDMDGEQGNACAVWCENLKEKGHLET